MEVDRNQFQFLRAGGAALASSSGPRAVPSLREGTVWASMHASLLNTFGFYVDGFTRRSSVPPPPPPLAGGMPAISRMSLEQRFEARRRLIPRWPAYPVISNSEMPVPASRLGFTAERKRALPFRPPRRYQLGTDTIKVGSPTLRDWTQRHEIQTRFSRNWSVISKNCTPFSRLIRLLYIEKEQ